MIGLCEYLSSVFILELGATAQRREQSVQIKRRFWNLLFREQCDPAVSLMRAISCISQTPHHLYQPSRNIRCNEPFPHLSKSPRHFLTDYPLTTPYDLPSIRDTRPENSTQTNSIRLLSPHAHLASKMLLAFRYVC